MLPSRNTVCDDETCSSTYDLVLLSMLRRQPNLSNQNIKH